MGVACEWCTYFSLSTRLKELQVVVMLRPGGSKNALILEASSSYNTNTLITLRSSVSWESLAYITSMKAL